MVIVGAWNKGIFNPKWVSKYLLPNEKLEVEVPLGVDAFFKISSKKVRIFVLGNKLNFSPINKTDENFDFIQELGLKTADYLPHTPVRAFGINFVFEEKIDERLSELLKLGDQKKLIQFGSKIKKGQYRHQLEIDEKLLNLTISTDHKTVAFDFNFHFDIKNLIEFKEGITNNNIVDQKKAALELMEKVYGLEFT
ncbi:hypothetical protein IH824_16910, partial [candidate division KSB1 bacterium]|nr:hypothetical protein [candidate division KSB1 bacterium]